MSRSERTPLSSEKRTYSIDQQLFGFYEESAEVIHQYFPRAYPEHVKAIADETSNNRSFVGDHARRKSL